LTSLEGLSGRVWPLHLKPRPDELLSSWLIRFAHAHQLKIESMCTLLFGRQSPVWNRDVDRLAPEWVLQGICQATGTHLQQAQRTTLVDLEGWLAETISPLGNSHWIVPLGIYHRARQHPGLMYCPACLSEEKSRYYRRLWRMAWATTCLTHQCLLVDTCPACGAPIVPHRSDMGARCYLPTPQTLITCHACQTLLTQQALLPVSTPLAALQAKLEDTLKNGYIPLGNNPCLHSVLFFEGLHALLTGGLRAKKQRSTNVKKHAPVFELRALEERRAILEQLAQWLNNWPEDFLTDIKVHGFRTTELSSQTGILPYWYHQVVRPLNQRTAAATETEAEAIMDAIAKQTGGYNLTAAQRLAGKNITSAWRHLHPLRRVNVDSYEMAVVEIDHQIAGTLDQSQRLLLLRTKFILVARYGLQLSIASLSKLTLASLHQLTSPIPDATFYEVPRSRVQAAAWLLWYWHHLRPLFSPASDENRVFTSHKTRRGLSVSACQFYSSLQGHIQKKTIHNPS